MKLEPFPRRIVTGEAFCNRAEEREKLALLLQQGTHVWMQAHRRHGKTSLLLQTVEDMTNNNQNIVIDRCHLLFTSGKESIIKQLLQSVSNLTAAVVDIENNNNGDIKQTFLEKVMKRFIQLNPKVGIDKGKFSLSFESTNDIDALKNGLKKLDELADESNIRVVLIIDEFQELGKSQDGILLESVIRDRLERASALTFVFCGSERALMSQAMSDTKRPLYNHTYHFELERILTKCYREHLNNMANRKWGSDLTTEAFDLIIDLTERHPYYVNAVCSELWLRTKVPTSDDVFMSWDKIVRVVEREEQRLFLSLKGNEKKTLAGIAKGHNIQMTSVRVTSAIGLGASTVTKTLKQLGNKDIISENEKGYYIINPCIKAIIKKYA